MDCKSEVYNLDKCGDKGEVIAVTSGKGGTGKTTTTANLGVALSKLGYNTVVVDMDIGLKNLDIILGMENEIELNIVDVIKGNIPYERAILKNKFYKNLYLLPASQIADKETLKASEVFEVYNYLKHIFDYVLIDCPAGIEQGFINATTGIDRAIVVSNPEVSSIRDNDRTIGLLNAKQNIPYDNINLIINRYRKKSVKNNDMLDVESVKDLLAIKLLGVIYEEDKVIVSANRGFSVTDYENSIAGKNYINSAKRLLGEKTNYYYKSDNGRDWFKKLKKMVMF